MNCWIFKTCFLSRVVVAVLMDSEILKTACLASIFATGKSIHPSEIVSSFVKWEIWDGWSLGSIPNVHILCHLQFLQNYLMGPLGESENLGRTLKVEPPSTRDILQAISKYFKWHKEQNFKWRHILMARQILFSLLRQAKWWQICCFNFRKSPS